MKIINVEAVRLTQPPREVTSQARRPSWWSRDEVANPMSRYSRFKQHRSLWRPKWEMVGCKVTLEDGTWGLGMTMNGRPVAAIIEDHLGPLLIGEDGFNIERIADMLFRMTKPYGTEGLASCAISAIDLALWDAKGKALNLPVYQLIGGAQKEYLTCYATGNDVDWCQELGFTAFKLACPYGPADGLDGLARNEAFVARVREQIGDQCELMLDCWMAFDVEYAVRLAERLRPYRLKWIEECLIPEDWDGHAELRRRLPWQTLTTGEHWYSHIPFQRAMRHDLVDIVQPDIMWCGGLTTCLKIAHAAEAAGKHVILHTGGRLPYGHHFSYAMPAVPWLEYFFEAAPGISLEDSRYMPGQAVAHGGRLVPSDAPGFGQGIEAEWLTPFFT
jgi:L-rhamnonate dehydratase